MKGSVDFADVPDELIARGAPVTLYRWRVRSRLPARFGATCRVLVRGGMNSCLVEFEDGYRVVTSRNYLRRIA